MEIWKDEVIYDSLFLVDTSRGDLTLGPIEQEEIISCRILTIS